jgi:hypothetical protein
MFNKAENIFELASTDLKIINLKANVDDKNKQEIVPKTAIPGKSRLLCAKKNERRRRLGQRRKLMENKNQFQINAKSRVKRISHKSIDNFLNDFETDLEQSSSQTSNKPFISNYEIFEIRSNNFAKNKDDDNRLTNIFQSNNVNYSKLLPWERTSKNKRCSISKSTKATNTSRLSNSISMSNQMLKEASTSKCSSYITIYDLSYKLREKNSSLKKIFTPKNSVNFEHENKSIHENSSSLLSENVSNKSVKIESSNDLLNTPSTKKSNAYKDIISRVLKSKISLQK